MERLTFKLPLMYGDHHVAEVHKALDALPGVMHVYASAAWRVVDLEYDAAQIDPDTIRRALQAHGYTERDLELPPISARTKSLTDYAVGPGGVEQFIEHVPAWGSPLGACPGFELRRPGDVHPGDQ